MRILIIGDAGSIFIKQYIEYVLCDRSNEIVLLQETVICDSYHKFYKENHIKLQPIICHENALIVKIPKIRSSLGIYILAKCIQREYGLFDLVHIHGLNFSRGNLGYYLQNHTKKIAVTVWGDEVFRKNHRTLQKYKKYYDIADYITLSTSDMKAAFVNAYGDKYSERISMNKFAVGVLDMIDSVKSSYSRKDLCVEFGITDCSKKIVFVGHNGRDAQRHIDITKLLKKLSDDRRRDIFLLYTMTYGVKSPEYLQELEREARETKCGYVILRDFLDEMKIAKLRSICDIMIHAQLTDAFSASLMECLYAGAVVLNGSWLAYNELPDCHDRFVEYDTLEEIPETLTKVLDHYEEYTYRTKENKEVIHSICSKEATTKAWKDALKI